MLDPSVLYYRTCMYMCGTISSTETLMPYSHELTCTQTPTRIVASNIIGPLRSGDSSSDSSQ